MPRLKTAASKFTASSLQDYSETLFGIRKRSLLAGSKVLCWIATAGPVGCIPVAPGTFGTLMAIPFAFVLGEFSWPISALGIMGFFLLGWVSAREIVKTSGANDPKQVVVDEMVGFLVASWLLPSDWGLLALAFFAFRFYDILKPFPASFFDQRVHGGLGVVMDDVISGLYVNLTLRILLWFKALLF
jgi:phosphatidylglycerophosphatase A